MGCDIHWVVERRYGDKWIGEYASDSDVKPPIEMFGHMFKTSSDWRELHAGRNYRFFAALAGVRGDGPDPLGFPADMSDLARVHLEDDNDLHSKTWMFLEEFEKRHGGEHGMLRWGDDRNMYRILIGFDN